MLLAPVQKAAAVGYAMRTLHLSGPPPMEIPPNPPFSKGGSSPIGITFSGNRLFKVSTYPCEENQ